MNKENLKYCLYYKGEPECPDGDYETFQRWWYLESEYYMVTDFDSLSAIWEKNANMWFKDIPELRNFIDDKRWNDRQRGFLCYAAVMPPMLPSTWILDYGRSK